MTNETDTTASLRQGRLISGHPATGLQRGDFRRKLLLGHRDRAGLDGPEEIVFQPE